MKKFAKFVLIFGSGMFFGGLLLALIALALGGDFNLVQRRLEQIGVVRGGGFWSWESPYNNDYRWDANPWDIPNIPDIPDIPNVPDIPNTPDTPAIPDLPDAPALPQEGKASDYAIKNLDFNFSLGDVRIIVGEDFELIYGNSNTRRHYWERRSGDTWSIGNNKVRWNWFSPWNNRLNDITLTVVLPRDFVAENITIRLGAGNMQAGYLSARQLLLDVGLGNCQVNSINAQNAGLNVGVGYLAVQNFAAGQAKLEVGLGSMEISLTQPLEQYRYHVEVGLGSVQLGGQNYSGVADVDGGTDSSPYSLDISCGLGSIKISLPVGIQM